jgi:hypothetical protein
MGMIHVLERFGSDRSGDLVCSLPANASATPITIPAPIITAATAPNTLSGCGVFLFLLSINCSSNINTEALLMCFSNVNANSYKTLLAIRKAILRQVKPGRSKGVRCPRILLI